MGIRCTFVTSFAGPRLPTWFVEKWKASVSLCPCEDGYAFPLSSKSRTKANWGGILEDIQRVLQDTYDGKWDPIIEFVYLHECCGVTHIQISRDAIVYCEPASWKPVEDANGHQHYDYCGPDKRLRPAEQSLPPGLLPSPGTATMADVERLVRAGEDVLAMRCYLEIHRVGLPEAQKAINDLRKTT
jgi:hypothetical protein